MYEEYKIRGIGHLAGGKLQYDWSYVLTRCSLTTKQRKTLMEKGYWVRPDLAKHILISKDMVEQTAIEADLTTMGVTFTTEDVAPTEREKQVITNAKIKRRDRIKSVLEKDAKIAIEIPSLATTLTAIDNISNLGDAKVIMKKLVRVVAHLHDLP